METDVKKGSTSISIYVELLDATDGVTPETGVVFGDVTASYVRTRGARVAISPVTLAAVTTAWTSGGFIEVDGTNQPGLYRFDVPNAAFAEASLVDGVVVTLKGAAWGTKHVHVRLRDYAESAQATSSVRTDN